MKTTLLISSLLAISASANAEETTPPLLPEVTIQAQRSPDQVSKSVLSGKQARHIAGTSGDPLKALQSLPGVVSSNSGRPAVRGSGPQDNAYYVDDLPIGKIFHVGGISVFNADLIRDFNLYSAAFPPHYGNVTGAVIDVALREPRRDKLGGKLNVNLLGADALIEAPINENQAFYFAARRSYIDLLIKQVERKGITVQIPNYADYQGKYVAQLSDNHKLTLHAQGATDTLKLNIGASSNLAQQDPILAGNLALSDRFNMQAVSLDSVLFNQTANKLAFEHIASGFTTKVGGAGNIAVAQDDVMLRERIIVPLSDSNELAIGSNLVRSKIDINADIKNTTCTQFNPNCNFTNAPNVRLLDSFISNAIDGSLQDRLHLNNALTLVTGVRYSYEDYLRRSYTEPRLGVEYQATPQTLYTAGWGRHNQMPTGQEISRNFGNPNLAHLRAEHSVLGITQQLDKDWSIKAESYYKKLSNLTVDNPTLNYINAGSGTAYGLEMLLKKDIAQPQSGDVTGWLSVSLAKSTRRNNLTGASFRYALDQPVNATWVANMQLEDGWSVGSKWQVHSGAPYTPINGSLGVYPNGGNIPNYGAINSGTLPTYHQLDVRLQREAVKNPEYTLNYYVELNNVYQHKNVIGYSYDPTYTTKEAIYPFVLPLSFGLQAEF